MSNPQSAQDSLLALLAEAGGLKLWSVIVTILGDLVPGPRQAMPGPVLSGLIAGIGLQPQAMRVALHRLKRDGWIESDRTGRIGRYRLSATGRAQTEAVRDRVYGPAPAPAAWQVVVLPPGAADPDGTVPEDLAYVPLAGRAMLMQRGAASPGDGWLLAEVAAMNRPDWLTAEIAAAACAADYAALDARLAAILAGPLPETLAGRTVLRVLALHAWRRLVLRANPAAEALLGPAAAPARCRTTVLAVLDRLPRPDPAALCAALSAV